MIVIRNMPSINKWINKVTTINKPYNVIAVHTNSNQYLIKNDEGSIHWVSGNSFKEIEEHRNDKINNILDES